MAVSQQAKAAVKKEPARDTRQPQKGKWEKPTLEDVSGKVMAQPYIRFT